MHQIIAGAVAMGLGVAGLFFLRFWRRTHDRLFAFFAIAFFILAGNRVVLTLTTLPEDKADLYWIRFFSFVMILAAIIDKNWDRSRRPSGNP